MNGPLALILVLGLVLGPAPAGCVSSHVGPGVLREDWNQPRRDPDPTRNPTEELRGNPWATEPEERIPPPGETPAGPDADEPDDPDDPSRRDRRTIDLAKRGAATFLAWAVAGWIPLLEMSGTFEEDPQQRQRHPRPDRRSDPE